MEEETCEHWYGDRHDFGTWNQLQEDLKVQQRKCKRCGYVEMRYC